MRKHMKTRFLAMLLAALMVFQQVGIDALAAEATETEETAVVASETEEVTVSVGDVSENAAESIVSESVVESSEESSTEAVESTVQETAVEENGGGVVAFAEEGGWTFPENYATYKPRNLECSSDSYSVSVSFVTNYSTSFYMIVSDDNTSKLCTDNTITYSDYNSYYTNYSYYTSSAYNSELGKYEYRYDDFKVTGLKAATKYYGRLAMYSYSDGGYVFLTDVMEFTTKDAITESAVTAKNLTVEAGGLAAKVKFQLDNPNNETINRVVLDTYNGETFLAELSIYTLDDDGYYEITLDYSNYLVPFYEEIQIYPSVYVPLGADGESTKVKLNETETVQIKSTKFAPEITNVEPGYKAAKFTIFFPGLTEMDIDTLTSGTIYVQSIEPYTLNSYNGFNQSYTGSTVYFNNSNTKLAEDGSGLIANVYCYNGVVQEKANYYFLQIYFRGEYSYITDKGTYATKKEMIDAGASSFIQKPAKTEVHVTPGFKSANVKLLIPGVGQDFIDEMKQFNYYSRVFYKGNDYFHTQYAYWTESSMVLDEDGVYISVTLPSLVVNCEHEIYVLDGIGDVYMDDTVITDTATGKFSTKSATTIASIKAKAKSAELTLLVPGVGQEFADEMNSTSIYSHFKYRKVGNSSWYSYSKNWSSYNGVLTDEGYSIKIMSSTLEPGTEYEFYVQDALGDVYYGEDIITADKVGKFTTVVEKKITSADIPDENFYNYLKKNYGKYNSETGETELLDSALENITSLSLSNGWYGSGLVNDLTGISYLPSLTSITLYGDSNEGAELSKIVIPSEISKLTDLKEFTAQYYTIDKADVQAISQISNLKNLNLSYNDWENGALDAFDTMSKVTTLSLYQMKTGSYDFLSKFVALTSLSLGVEENITSITLPEIATLETLYISGRDVKEIKGLEKETALKYISFNSVAFTSLEFLAKNVNLNKIEISQTKLKSLKGIENLTKLTSLEVYSCGLESLEGIEGLTSLTSVNVQYNKLKSIDPIKNLINLQYFYASDNNISSIPDLSGLTKLYQYGFTLTENYLSEQGIPDAYLPSQLADTTWKSETLLRQKELIENSKLDLVTARLESVGYVGATFYFKYVNPDNERNAVYYFVDESGNMIDKYENDIYYGYDENSIQVNLALPSGKTTKVRLCLRAIQGCGDYKYVYSDEFEVTVPSSEKLQPKASSKVAGNTVMFDVVAADLTDCDRESLSVKIELVNKNNAEDKAIRTNSLTYDSNDKSSYATLTFSDLTESATYNYKVSLVYDDQTYGKPVTGTVTTQTLITYTTEEFEKMVPDEILRNLIVSGIGSSTFTNASLAKVTYISNSKYSASQNVVHDLTGISYCPFLRSVYLQGNEITDASEILKLNELRFLDLGNNNLTKMPDLSKLENLLSIGLNNNMIVQSDIVETKLPAKYVAGENYNINWISNTRNSQRKEYAIRFAPKYYSITSNNGEISWPLIFGFEGVRWNERYNISFELDGETYTTSGYVYGGSATQIIYVSDLHPDLTNGNKKQIPYTVTKNDGTVIFQDTVEVEFVTDNTTTKRLNYCAASDNSVYVNMTITYDQYQMLQNGKYDFVLKKGNQLYGAMSNHSTYTSSVSENRYKDVFGDVYISTGLREYVLRGTIDFAKTLPAGTYDVVCRNAAGEEQFTIEGALECMSTAMITNVESYSYDLDANGDYVYVQMSGYYFDPAKVHPVFTDDSGNTALTFVDEKVYNIVYYGSGAATVILKYKKTGDLWGQNNDYISLNWKLQVASGYKCTALQESGTMSFSITESHAYAVYYNYKKSTMETILSSDFKKGTKVTVKVSRSSEGTLYEGSGVVDDNHILAYQLYDMEGDQFVPRYEDRYNIYYYFEFYVDEVERLRTGSYINWYNYSQSYSGGGDYNNLYFVRSVNGKDTNYSSGYLRTTDRSMKISGYFESYKNKSLYVKFFDKDDQVIDSANISVGKNADVTAVTLKWTKDLEPGTYSVKVYETEDAETYICSSNVRVYDNNYFYTETQSAWFAGDDLIVEIGSHQYEGEYSYGTGSLYTESKLLNKSSYKITLRDKVGNIIKDNVTPSAVSGNGYYVTYTVKNVPKDYYGYYIYVTYDNKVGVRINNMSITYYENVNSSKPEYGEWTGFGSSNKGSFSSSSNENRRGIYRAWLYDKTEGPATIYVYQPGYANPVKTFKTGTPTSDNYYYDFTASDVSGLENNIYRVALVGKSGNILYTDTGYVVAAATASPVVPTGVTLDKTTLSLASGKSASLVATIAPANANSQTAITWTTSDDKVATVVNGVVTAVGVGSATITATTANGKSAKCTVTVTAPTNVVTSVTLTAPKTVLGLNEKVQLSAKYLPSDAEIGTALTFTTDNASVVSVDDKGMVTAVGIGTATVTVTTANNCKATVNLTVIYGTGSCGATADWLLDATGELVISGSGAMKDYASASETPWSAYAEQIQKITVQPGVNVIGKNAFAGLNVESAQIPVSVDKISENAFAGATVGAALYDGTKEDFANVTVEGGNGAFVDQLKTIVFPEGLWMLNIPDQAYTGIALKPELNVYYGSTYLVEGVDYTVAWKNNIVAAKSTDKKAPTATIKGKGKFSGSLVKTFNIDKSLIDESNVVIEDSYKVNDVIAPAVVLEGNVLKVKKDYTLSFYDVYKNVAMAKAPKTAGQYQCIITPVATGSVVCEGNSIVIPFEITSENAKLSIAKAKATVAAMTYGDEKTTISLVLNGVTLKEGTDFIAQYSNIGAKGKGTVTMIGIGDYTGVLTKPVTVAAKSIANAQVTKIGNPIYTKSGATQDLFVMVDGVQLMLGRDIKVAYKNNKVVGSTATVTVTGMGNYTGSLAPIGFTVDKASLDDVTLMVADILVEGKAPVVTVIDAAGKKLTAKKDYEIVLDQENKTVNLKAGSNGLYTDRTLEAVSYRLITKEQTVTAVKIDKNALAAAGFTTEYTGSAIELPANAIQVMAGKTQLKAEQYEITYVNNVNVGTATIVVKGVDGFGGTKTATFKITAKKINVLSKFFDSLSSLLK